MASHSATGYVNDVPYTWSFTRELAPAWLDFVATLAGFEPPSRSGRFAWCELGCGRGLTAAVIAGTHPRGAVHGIDAYAPHVEQARRLGERSGIANLTLHALDFASAVDLRLPRFDYIVAHGVYAWIDARGRADLRRLIDRRLKPGGVAFVSYNAMPGWASDAPFQHLVREIAATCEGDSIAQVAEAMTVMDAFSAAGAPALKAGLMSSNGWKQVRRTRPMSYFAHEFLPLAWQPLYVTQVRREMAGIGLVPAGSATVEDNFDAFVLKPAASRILATVSDPDLRELARDYFLYQRFRRDVLVRGARPLRDAERRERLSETVFDLQRPAGDVRYAMDTPAGHVAFGSRTARAIVSALRRGPRRLADVPRGGASRADLLANALALCAADGILPVGPDAADVSALNGALLQSPDGARERPYVALRSGTAVRVPPALFRILRDGGAVPARLRAWWGFLERRCGVPPAKVHSRA